MNICSLLTGKKRGLQSVKITIICDNESNQPGLIADWSFSCIIETKDTPKILFDTGATGSALLNNMKTLKFDPADIGIVVISHPHQDHISGFQ